MKVYIVTEGTYSEYHIVGAFLDREKAEFAASFPGEYRDERRVEIYDTLDDRVAGETVEWVEVIHQWGGSFRILERHSGAFVPPDDHDSGHWYRIPRLSGERDRDEVYLKIAQDRHAQWQAEQKGIA